MHEIITLQLGQRSNYVATHFWNAQESYFTYSGDEDSPVDHDVHFRPGIGADGTETFTPRTVMYDLKGAFGSLRKINALYEKQEEGGMPRGLWDGPTIVQQQPAIEQTPYQASLDQGIEPPALTPSTVRYWSDFNRVFYHPRSIVQLSEYELHSTLMPFERWDVGEELFKDLDKEHDLLDRDLRPFAEECDQLQGIQLTTSVDDAWGGFSARYLDRIRDEFGKTSLWVWGLEDGRRVEREKRLTKTVNTALSMRDVCPQASVYIPVSEPPSKSAQHLSIDERSPWHTSALTSAAIESMTLPSRMKRTGHNALSASSLSEMETVLNPHGNQNIARLGLSAERHEAENGIHDRGNGNLHRASSQRRYHAGGVNEASDAPLADFDMDLFPASMSVQNRRAHANAHTFTRVEVRRGKGQDEEEETSRPRRGLGEEPVVQQFRTTLSYPQPDSFPRIFSPLCRVPEELRIRSGLSVDSSTGDHLRALRRAAAVGLARDEQEALTNTLGEMAEAYDHGWQSGSDEDDDD